MITASQVIHVGKLANPSAVVVHGFENWEPFQASCTVAESHSFWWQRIPTLWDLQPVIMVYHRVPTNLLL
jgi:hypothetical protein